MEGKLSKRNRSLGSTNYHGSWDLGRGLSLRKAEGDEPADFISIREIRHVSKSTWQPLGWNGGSFELDCGDRRYEFALEKEALSEDWLYLIRKELILDGERRKMPIGRGEEEWEADIYLIMIRDRIRP